MLIRTVSLVLCLIVCATVCGCTGKSVSSAQNGENQSKTAIKELKVTKDPITYAQTEVDSQLGRDALTHWFFHCIPKFEHQVVEEVVNPEGAHVSIRITGAALEIGLSIKQLVGSHPTPRLRSHEHGHIEICKRLYEHAERPARAALQGAIGQIFSGAGKDRPAALKQAMVSASEFVCHQYSTETARRADKLSAEYDRLTNHGANQLPPEQALARLFSAEE